MQIPIDAGCCLIRPFQTSDRESLVRHANNRRVARNMRDQFPHPYTLVEADAWLTVARTAESAHQICNRRR